MDKKSELEIITRLTRIEEKLDDYKEVKDKSDNAFNIALQNKNEIKEIKEQIKWLTRTIAAACITGIVGIVFIFIKSGMGI